MHFPRKPTIPSELSGVDARLRRRPELDEDSLALVAARARSRARTSALTDSYKEPSLRSRLAIVLTLALGFGLSTTGVGLAVSGIASDGVDAAAQQYGGKTPTQPDTGPTLTPTAPPVDQPPVTQPEGPTTDGEDDGPVVRGETDEGGEGAAPTQEARQLGAEVSGESLPFTGFAAIPVLLLGLVLLATGFVLRGRKPGA